MGAVTNSITLGLPHVQDMGILAPLSVNLLLTMAVMIYPGCCQEIVPLEK